MLAAHFSFFLLRENPVRHCRKIFLGNLCFPVRDGKAGPHKRSSSKARATISRKEFLGGINYQKITGTPGNHFGKTLLRKGGYVYESWPGQEPPLDAHHPLMPGTPDPMNFSVNIFLSREISEPRNP